MRFKQAVLREHQRDYITDPYETCVALRCTKDSNELSVFHQFIKTPGKGAFFPDTAHVIASVSNVKKAEAFYKKTYGTGLHVIGDTYCVAPYTIGFARYGTDHKNYFEDALKIMGKKDYFHCYLRSWVDTSEGYKTMLGDMGKKGSRPDMPKDWDEFVITAQKNPSDCLISDIDDLKTFYVEHFTNTKWSGHKAFVQKRKEEFREATTALTQAELVAKYERYYLQELNQEDLLRQKNLDEYAQTPRLLQNVIQ